MSNPREFHPYLSEPDVNLSANIALIIQPQDPICQWTNKIESHLAIFPSQPLARHLWPATLLYLRWAQRVKARFICLSIKVHFRFVKVSLLSTNLNRTHLGPVNLGLYT